MKHHLYIIITQIGLKLHFHLYTLIKTYIIIFRGTNLPFNSKHIKYTISLRLGTSIIAHRFYTKNLEITFIEINTSNAYSHN